MPHPGDRQRYPRQQCRSHRKTKRMRCGRCVRESVVLRMAVNRFAISVNHPVIKAGSGEHIHRDKVRHIHRSARFRESQYRLSSLSNTYPDSHPMARIPSTPAWSKNAFGPAMRAGPASDPITTILRGLTSGSVPLTFFSSTMLAASICCTRVPWSDCTLTFEFVAPFG